MFRFRTDVAVFAGTGIAALSGLTLISALLKDKIATALPGLLRAAGSPEGLAWMTVLAVAALAGFAAGLPQRMPRYGGAPPKGALTKVLAPVVVLALAAAAVVLAATWLAGNPVLSSTLHPVRLYLSQALGALVLLRCIFLMYRISDECKMAVQSADWP